MSQIFAKLKYNETTAKDLSLVSERV